MVGRSACRPARCHLSDELLGTRCAHRRSVREADGSGAIELIAQSLGVGLCLDGEFTIDLRDRAPIILRSRDVYTVARGVEHRPRAVPGTRILMFEPQGTPSTGDQGEVEHVITTTGVSID